MDPSDGSDIETAALPAVSSLRSKFEQLGVGKPPLPAGRNPLGSRSPGPSNPRPPDLPSRKPSQAYNGEQTAEISATDLKAGIRRAPPVPPRTPQPASTPLPVLSPLFRPIPTPSASPLIGQQALPGSSPRRIVSRTGADTLVAPPSGGVAALRNQFV